MNCPRCHLDRPQWEFLIRYVTDDHVCRETHCSTCRNELTRKWRESNPDKMAAAKKRWNQTHPQQCREARKRNRLANPAALSIRRKRYRTKYRVRETDRTRAWHRAHPLVRQQQKKRWRRRVIAELRPLYLRELLAHHHGRRIKPTAEQLNDQKRKTEICRTVHQFKLMAAASKLLRPE